VDAVSSSPSCRQYDEDENGEDGDELPAGSM